MRPDAKHKKVWRKNGRDARRHEKTGRRVPFAEQTLVNGLVAQDDGSLLLAPRERTR